MTSKFRFVKAHEGRQEDQFLNVAPTGAIWDGSNFMACNAKFIACPWQQLGSCVVLRHDEVGKLASPPHQMVLGQSGNIIDMSFNPFDQNMLVTASEDSTIRGWHIPDEGVKERTDKALFVLEGHSKKVGCLAWHPSADGVLASASVDGTVKIWDIVNQKEMYSYKITSDQIISLNFNIDGSQFCTTSKDKMLRINDTRTGAELAKTMAHDGSKAQRCLWHKRRNVIITSGFTSRQHRQIKLWDATNLATPTHVEEIDQQSAVMMPILDEDTGLLYLAGKGDGSIMYYELKETGGMVRASAYSTSLPQKGVCMMPKSSMLTRKCELARIYKLTAKTISCISMQMPRRNAETEFQEEVYPPTYAAIPAIKGSEFFAGTNATPIMQDMRGIFDDKGEVIIKADGTTQHIAPTPQAAPKAEEPNVEVKPVEVAKPAEVVKPVEAVKPAEVVKPVEKVAEVKAEEPKVEDKKWDGQSVPTPEQLAEQKAAVDALKAQIESATAVYDAMVAKLPKAEEPKTEEVKAEEPKTEEVKAEEPKAEEVKAEEPKAEEPKAEEVKAEEPKAEEVKAEEVKAEEPKAEEVKAEEPKTEEVKAEEVKAVEVKAE